MIHLETLKKCKQGTIVAFKCKTFKKWFTGQIKYIDPPEESCNWFLSIEVLVPTYLKWIEDAWTEDTDKKPFYIYLNEISALIILEIGEN